MPIRISTDERGVITGATGTGKTTCVKRLLIPAIPSSHVTIIVDPKRDRAWRDVPDIKRGILPGTFNFVPGLQAFRFSEKVSNSGSDDALGFDPSFNGLLTAIWKVGNALLISDETASLYPDRFSLTTNAGRLIRMGRQRNIGIWWLMQRPKDVPLSIVTESEWAVVYTLRYRADRVRMAETFGDELLALPPQEQGNRSHYFYFAKLPDKPKLMRLNLNGHA